MLKGLTTLPIGLLLIDSSPSKTDLNFLPASTPDINLIVVPELPTFKI